MTTRNRIVQEIARSLLRLDTLEPQGRDSLDFHELAVWQIRDALEAAYDAGRQARRAIPLPGGAEPETAAVDDPEAAEVKQ